MTPVVKSDSFGREMIAGTKFYRAQDSSACDFSCM